MTMRSFEAKKVYRHTLNQTLYDQLRQECCLRKVMNEFCMLHIENDFASSKRFFNVAAVIQNCCGDNVNRYNNMNRYYNNNSCDIVTTAILVF